MFAGRSEAAEIIDFFHSWIFFGYKKSLDFIFLLQSVRKSLKQGFAVRASLPAQVHTELPKLGISSLKLGRAMHMARLFFIENWRFGPFSFR